MKQLMEEKKWAQDKVRELNKKREQETTHLNRQNEIVAQVKNQIAQMRQEIEDQEDLDD